MRVMVIVKATKESEAGVMPSEELLTTMGKYNEELVKAGIMLAGDGLLKLGRFEGARTEFETTASMTRNARTVSYSWSEPGPRRGTAEGWLVLG